MTWWWIRIGFSNLVRKTDSKTGITCKIPFWCSKLCWFALSNDDLANISQRASRQVFLLWTRKKLKSFSLISLKSSFERARSAFENFRELKMMSRQSLEAYCYALIFRKGNIIPLLYILIENSQRSFQMVCAQDWYSLSSLSFSFFTIKISI